MPMPVLEREAEERFVLHQTKGKYRIVLDEENDRILIQDREGVTILAINTVDNSIELTSLGDLTLRAEGKVKVEGRQGIDLTTPGEMNLLSEGQANLISTDETIIRGALVRIN